MSGAGDSARSAARIGNKAAASNKYSIEIVIDGHFSSKVYTSGSAISGHAIVKTASNVSFDYFDIVFTGIAATRLDFVQQYPSHSLRPFMKLRMPVSQSDIPEDHIFKAGQTYKVPFNFVVPHHLPIGACKHNCESDSVKDHHLRLPPSVGYWGADDQAPEMAHIEYAIKARGIVAPANANAYKCLEGHHMVKVLPATPEDAPLDITFRDERYTMSKTKTIRKNLFSPKTGKLTATGAQPGAIMLSPDGHKASFSSARVNLEFTPDSVETAPPKVNSVNAKLVATTFFGAAPADHLPNLGPRTSYRSNPCLNYITTNNLFTLSLDKVAWKQEKVSAARRDSGYSSSHMDLDSSETEAVDKTASPIKHTTSLDVPFTINNTNKKFFLPSFHSCLISRAYTLQLTLSVGPTNTTVSLAIPVQIGVESQYEQHDDELPSFETAMAQSEEDQADAYLRPRMMRLPSDIAQNNSLLPGYDELRRRATVPVA